MWQIDYPWLLLMLPLPWLGYRYLGEYREPRDALRVPFFAAVSRAIGQTPGRSGPRGSRGQLLLNLSLWILLVVACARPVLLEKPIERQQPVRDLLLALDISQSMETTDYTDASGRRIDRLSAVKGVVRDFIARRPDDRLGLIVFGTGAYPQAPPTRDHASLNLLLEEIGIGMAGPNTAIGDAIGLAVKLLEGAREKDRLLILLTDGNDTGSAIPPTRAARLAADAGILVHTIAIGDANASGDAKVDLQELRDIARATGGRFFQAADRDALEQAYATLDSLTPHQVKTLGHQPKRDLFWIPLGLGLILLVLYHGLAALHRQPARTAAPRPGQGG
ncbi:VWA domain-containing protein [Zestomonas carbonaria]|uniref:VWFA domain-containing protein n=1 Tax=Zestomonas carbonaria TaxID=2762745 RepID=A0A7U7IAY8_9GAMM|nr:VWA domain-containing protein [Pseudomonas carbonaria]CAD5109386.1 hypothetical protein PSEWESI4_03683 [Pseudomonas carbonaria]